MPAPQSLKEGFKELSDPQIEKNSPQIASYCHQNNMAAVGRAEKLYEIAMLGQEKEQRVRKYLDLPNGIPSHNCFRSGNRQNLARKTSKWTVEVYFE